MTNLQSELHGTAGNQHLIAVLESEGRERGREGERGGEGERGEKGGEGRGGKGEAREKWKEREEERASLERGRVQMETG